MRKRTAVIAAVAVVAVGGGIAYAAWSSTGSGAGKVGSTTSVDSQISPVDGAGGLYPGGSTTFPAASGGNDGAELGSTCIEKHRFCSG